MNAPTESVRNARGASRIFLIFAAVLALFRCTTTEDPTGGETHFLTVCGVDSARCGEGLVCLCGVCTRSCSNDTECGELPAAECRAPADPSACANVAAHCDATCSSDADCRAVSTSHRCVNDVCRAGPADPNGGSGGTGGSGQGGSGNDCATGAVEANQVLVIGDSFFAISHEITAYLEQYARDAGVLAAGERYRDNSSTADNALAMGGTGIMNQYVRAVGEAPVSVVIMDGGGIDMLLAACADPVIECPALVAAAAAAETLLARMATDGVTHVVYAFYPDPVDPTQREKMDALRLLVEPVCASSPTPCHWVDLRAPFAAQSGTLSEDGLLPTAAGSVVTANAIWDVMTRECIAQ